VFILNVTLRARQIKVDFYYTNIYKITTMISIYKLATSLFLFCLLGSFNFVYGQAEQKQKEGEREGQGSVFGTKLADQAISKDSPSQSLSLGANEKKPKVNRVELFVKIDKDLSGRLSKEEFMATKSSKRAPTKAALSFAAMDKNSDGLLSLEEFKSPPKKYPKKKSS